MIDHLLKLRNFLVAGILAVSFLPLSAGGNQNTTKIMHEIYDSIVYLLPLSLREPSNSSPWDNELIKDKLQILKTASAALKDHTNNHDQETRGLARSFDHLSTNVAKAFSNEWPEFAYFSVMDLMQHCVACHSRVGAPSQELFGQRMIARMDTRELPPEDVVRVFVALRQFDAALESIEKILLDQNLSPIDADYGGLMVEYLQIAIGAKRSPSMAKDFLIEYQTRRELPFYLSRRVEFWRHALDELSNDIVGQPNLGRAKSIFYGADALSRGPGDRIRAVHDITAASIIRTFLSKQPNLTPEELAESYYILGVVALRTMAPKSAVPEMEMLLAASIEALPSGPLARESLALIEEYGFVHGYHLGEERSEQEQTLVDVPALRALIGP